MSRSPSITRKTFRMRGSYKTKPVTKLSVRYARLCRSLLRFAIQDLCLAPGVLGVTQNRGTQRTSHVTRHTPHAIRQTLHVTHHTSHVTSHTCHVTRHKSQVTRVTSHVTSHKSHFTHDTSHAKHLEDADSSCGQGMQHCVAANLCDV